MTKIFSFSPLYLFICFLLAISLLLLLPKNIHSDSNLMLNGKIFNKTLDANYIPNSNEVVLLHIIDKDEPVKTLEGEINQNGTFLFTIPSPDEGSKFLFSFDYKGIPYTIESLYLKERDYSKYTYEIEIFEIHQDLSRITFGESVMVVSGVDVNNQILQIFERVEIINLGILTYLPDFTTPSQMNFLRFSLPERASNITFEGDLTTGDVLRVDKGFALRNPILPGKYELSYFYQLPYSSKEIEISKSFRANTDSFKILMPTWVGMISSQAFFDVTLLTIGDEEFYFAVLNDISDGTKVEIIFSKLKIPSIYSKIKSWINGPGSYTLVLIFCSISLAFIFGLLIFKRRFHRNQLISTIPEDFSDEYFDALIRKIVANFAKTPQNNNFLESYKGDLSLISEILLLMFFRKHSFLIKEDIYEQDI